MSYINKTVSLNSDEKTFIKAFVKELTSADSRITCDDDIDEAFKDSYVQFEVNFGENFHVTFGRNDGYAYFADVYINGNKNVIDGGLQYSESGISRDIVAMRTWKLIVVSNEKSIYVMFGNYNSTMPESPKFSIMGLLDGSFSAATFATDTDILSSDIIGTSTGNEGSTYKFADRLNYGVADGSVEIIKDKALLNDTSKFIDFAGLYDCTTMPSTLNVTIDDKRYYTLNNHTLMPY